MKLRSYFLFVLCLIVFLAVGCGGDTVEPVVTPEVPVVPEEPEEPMEDRFADLDPNLPSFVSVENTTPEGMKWTKVEALSDDFDTWDRSKWHKPLWNYGVPVSMRDENSGVADGNLWIQAGVDEGAERWFKTSRVMSNTQINYPMYTEARIKNAHISAYNTYWLNNGDISNRNEIDIIENNSNPSCNCQPDFPWQMNSQYFHVIDDDTRRNKGNFDNRELSDDNPMQGVQWQEDYHTFGLWWQDERNIQFYLDGEPAGRVRSERDFTRELNIIFDLWTFDATWLGGLAKKENVRNDSLNTMRIDWIRTWQLEAE